MDDDSKSNPENKQNDVFHDAPDEFPFYESSSSSSIHHTHDSLLNPLLQPNSIFHSPTAPPRLRRRSLSHRFRHDSATISGNNSNPVSHSSSYYGPNNDNIKRVDQKSVSENKYSEFSGDGEGSEITDDVAIGSGFERERVFSRNIDDLVDENDDSVLVNNSVETEVKDDPGTFVGFDSAASKERRKRFIEKLEELADGEVKDGSFDLPSGGENSSNLVDENDDSVLVNNSVETELKDDPSTFVGFDSAASKERRKRFIEKLEELADGEVKDGSFDLPSGGENSSNSVTNSVNAEIRDSASNGSLGFDYNTASDNRRKRFAKRIQVLKMRTENSELQTDSNSLNEQNRNIAATNVGNDDELFVDNESSSGFLFGLAGLVIKAIGLQLSLLFSLVIFPLKFMYSVYMFVVDPFQIARRGKDYVRSRLFKIVGFVCQKFLSFAGEWLKEHKSIWQLVLRFGWGFLWAAYVCIVLFSLLISAFMFSGVLVKKLVDEPIQMKEALVFDYTKNSPVAFVPITSCPSDPRHVSFAEKSDVGKTRFSRVIPQNHKLQATVSLMLPESDYNRNLGMFQVRVDLLSANGGTLTSSRRSCMLHFKSQSIRMLLIFFKIAPLITGYSSESQTLNINLRGLIEKDIPTSCLRVIIEQRAEFRPGAGIPEIYEAFLTFESELPLLKKLMWQWKRTLFIWLGLSMFMMELLLALICCRPLLLPRRGVRDGSAGNIASPDNHPAQR